MAESSPPEHLIGMARRRSSRGNASPKTPSHPSNGYAVMEDDVLPASSVDMSPGRLNYGCGNDMQPEAGKDASSPHTTTLYCSSPGMNEISFDSQSSNNLTPGGGGDTDVNSLSQEDERDYVVVSQEDVPADCDNNGDIPSKPRGNASKTARRRSLRLQAKTTDEDGCGPSRDTRDLEEKEDYAASKPSSRRRSLRILAKRLDSSDESDDAQPVDMAKKGKPKRSVTEKMDKDALSQSKRRNVGEREVPVASEKLEHVATSSSFQIGMSENGHVKLVSALEHIAVDVIVGPSSFDNVSKRKSAGRSKKRGHRAEASVLSLLGAEAGAGSGKENALNGSGKKARSRKRRDTFDLSRKKRGLTSAAKRIDDLNVFIDDDVPADDADPDYLTPKAGTEVNINAIVNEMSRSLNDEPKDVYQDKEDKVLDDMELSVVKSNLQALSSIAIEEKMRQMFPDIIGQLYNYPCVSARIIAAMGIVYEDQANFTPLLPFLLSLVDAEIISLKNKEETEVCCINKKVHFSGFDYSSTTTTVGAVVGQGGGDLRPSIEALEAILQEALKLPRPMHYLTVAIQSLQCMASCRESSEACAKTMLGWYPSSRFEKALKHYVDELKDIKRYVTSTQNIHVGDDHLGIRYRLNDFIGRSVRFHLRELLNSIPEGVVQLNTRDCEERWGRAVDDGSFSSILNFSLEKVHEMMTLQPDIFEYGIKAMPEFFTSEAHTKVLSMSRDDLKQMDKPTYEGLVMDIVEARSFLFGARACRFVLELLSIPGVEEHINAAGGWGVVETIASTFYNLKLYEGSENEHFVQLREVRDLIFMLEEIDSRFEETVEKSEYCIRRLRRKLNFKTNSSFIRNIKLNLAGEKNEYFPRVVTKEEG